MSIPPNLRVSLHPQPGVREIQCSDYHQANYVQMGFFKRGVFGKVRFDEIHGWLFSFDEEQE